MQHTRVMQEEQKQKKLAKIATQALEAGETIKSSEKPHLIKRNASEKNID